MEFLIDFFVSPKKSDLLKDARLNLLALQNQFLANDSEILSRSI
jgi:hypothetical protein